MKELNENNLYIRVLKFGENHPEGFTLRQLQSELNFTATERRIIEEYTTNTLLIGRNLGGNMGTQPVYDSIFVLLDRGDNSTENAIFTLKYDAYFNYIDFRELQEALKSSKEAKGIAIISIIIAIITGLFQVSEDSLLLKFLSTLF